MTIDPSGVPLDDHDAYREAWMARWEQEQAEEEAKRTVEAALQLKELGLSPQEARCDSCLVIAVSEQLLRRAAPSTHKSLDKDGLVPLDKMEMLAPGYFRSPDDGRFVLIASPAFRRNLGDSGTYGDMFFNSLYRAARVHGAVPRIRFSLNELGIADSYKMCLEEDYWRGAESLNDLRELEEGHVKRHTFFDAAMAELRGFVSAEIHVQGADDRGVRGVRIEEVHYKPNQVAFSDGRVLFAERYVHAELHPDGVIGHLDGALRGYADAEWFARRDIHSTDIRAFGRVGVYEKQFRIDAPLSQTEFSDIVVGFFRGNLLVTEMLEGLGDDVTRG